MISMGDNCSYEPITQPKTFVKTNQFSILTPPRCLRTPRTVPSYKTSPTLPLRRKIILQYLSAPTTTNPNILCISVHLYVLKQPYDYPIKHHEPGL